MSGLFILCFIFRFVLFYFPVFSPCFSLLARFLNSLDGEQKTEVQMERHCFSLINVASMIPRNRLEQ